MKLIKLDTADLKKEGELEGLLVAAKAYDQVDQFIWLLKYQFVTVLAWPLAGLMVERIKRAKLSGEFILVPVPLHSRRERERGFNQAHLLASFLVQELGWQINPVLLRKKYTRPQVSLSRKQRLKNVKDVFLLACELPAQARVILVDDVYTTGATMQECAKVLKQAGVAKVYGLVLARG